MPDADSEQSTLEPLLARPAPPEIISIHGERDTDVKFTYYPKNQGQRFRSSKGSMELSDGKPPRIEHDVRSPRPSFFGQLGTMLQRNLRLKWKSKCSSLLGEILIPGLFVAVFILSTRMTEHPIKTPDPAITEFHEHPFTFLRINDVSVAYAPANPRTKQLLASTVEILLEQDASRRVNLTSHGFATPDDMYAAYGKNQYAFPADAGLVFKDPQLDTLDYALRFNNYDVPGVKKPYISQNNLCRPTLDSTSEDEVKSRARAQDCRPEFYASKGFSALQTALTTAYMKSKGMPNFNLPNLSSKLLPLPEERILAPSEATGSVLATPLILMTFVILAHVLVSVVAMEKEKKYIVNMKIMGLRPSVYWTSWILLYGLLILLVSLIFVFAGVTSGMWSHSNPFLLLLACLMAAGCLVSIAFCIAPFFRRPLIAGLVVFVVEVILVSIATVTDMLVTTVSGRWALSLIPTNAFQMAISRVGKAEAFGEGLGWANANDAPGFNYASALGMLFIDLLLYSLLAWYIARVVPYDDSPREVPWFFLLPSYWFPGRNHKRRSETSVDMETLFQTGDVEKVPDVIRSKTAVKINHLTKVFPGRSKTIAVNEFTYEAYEDEILAVLGHNGAGKTTLISMLTGILRPTSGTAIIYGLDVANAAELEIARTMIGFCPQHNVLFEDFTVKEHLMFFAKLKGFTGKAAKSEYERLINSIDMVAAKNTPAKSLSGGMKRRLSIAIAVLGNPKLLILDEPSSGVDIASQRFFWDMIRSFKKDRCVMIATQSMQEADVLADRKLIMSHGKLRCAGSSLFLKNRFGLGYYLTMAVQKECDTAKVTNLVLATLPGSERTRSHAGELTFVLPKQKVSLYANLFNKIDEEKSRLLIESYGVSLTTMEEIFLRLADEDKDVPTAVKDLAKKPVLEKQRSNKSYQPMDSSTFSLPKKGDVSTWSKFWALAKIRVLLMIRSKFAVFFQLVFPAINMLMLGIITLAVRKVYAVDPVVEDDALTGEQMGSGFTDAGSRFFCENLTGYPVEGILRTFAQSGLTMDSSRYADLANTGGHHGGYILHSASSANLTAVIGFNSTAFHAIPFLTNALLNAVFQLNTGSSEVFRFASYPFPYQHEKAATIEASDMVSMVFVMLIGMALSMIPGVFGLDVCRDRVWKTRSQIRMTGCSFWLYWNSAFFIHFVQFCLTFVVVVVFAYAFQMNGVTEVMPYLFLLFLLYAVASTLFCYCLSFAFGKISTATSGLTGPFMLVSYLLYMTVFYLNTSSKSPDSGDASSKRDTAKTLHYTFSFLFPGYGLYGGLSKLLEVRMKKDPNVSYFSWDSGFPVVLVAYVIHIPLLLMILIILESRFYNQHWLQVFGIRSSARSVVVDRRPGHEDNDVARERTAVEKLDPGLMKNYALLLRNLWKEFVSGGNVCRRGGREVKVAVKNLSMSFAKGEIFGLLGPNGAGKTTAISMITGELTPTSGDVHVNGYNMHTETDRALETMGSCPQVDTLWEDITMAEHLELFGTLNDLAVQRRAESIDKFTEGLHIREHMKKRSGALSGGTKRKLTFVISMIGNPPLVMLDEPSTGMDPQSKRNLWDMIMTSFTGQRGAILTTHSMEEADALCDRIGIIIKGELRCIGSSQHLKNKFGSGYLLEIKLGLPSEFTAADRGAAVERTNAAVGRLIENASCTEELHNRLIFAVPREHCPPLGRVFAELERLKTVEHFEEYSFSQSTIEQVFLHFARLQDTDDAPSLNLVGVQVNSS